MKRNLLIVCCLGLCVVGVFSKPADFDLLADDSKHYVQGAGQSYNEAQHSEHGEAGNKAYDSKHEAERGLQGHHDKERHQKEYAEEGEFIEVQRQQKAHNHDDGYYASGHKGSHGEKGYSFVDSGSYAKGHSTKGHHDVHKLDEYKKKKEFFDEDHDAAHKERHGGYELGKDFKNGEFKYGGHAKKVYFEGEFGATGKAEKGAHDLEDAGHLHAKGRDEYFKDAEEFVKKGNAEFFNNFGYELKKPEAVY